MIASIETLNLLRVVLVLVHKTPLRLVWSKGLEGLRRLAPLGLVLSVFSTDKTLRGVPHNAFVVGEIDDSRYSSKVCAKHNESQRST